ncbi:hypothetical protein CQ049_03415 [Brucella thiophenivorans]|nr:hypothetical protein CQ049_03415 [Brucella thiophenivorans]
MPETPERVSIRLNQIGASQHLFSRTSFPEAVSHFSGYVLKENAMMNWVFVLQGVIAIGLAGLAIAVILRHRR